MPIQVIRRWIANRREPPKDQEKVETTAETITETLKEEHTRLVVVGKEAHFTDKIIEYAIDMAKMTGYEIVAVSTAPLLSCGTLDKLSHHKDNVCTDFEAMAKEAIKLFREKAEENGVSFRHIIKFYQRKDILI